MDPFAVLTTATDASLLAALVPNPEADLPEEVNSSLVILFGWAKGVIVVIGVIGILFSAGRMALGKMGRTDLAADGIGSLVWVVFGLSLMMVAIPIVTEFL
ncbi:hypothetical protein [Nocardiopsis synnemataformans]|uniref:hypothetical protein n=1 Tax=Nocardiopsis synnemataformans TaxID=61305 RepID=UPI003EB91B7A